MDDVLNILTSALEGKYINLEIYDGDTVIKSYEKALSKDLTFNFDISEFNLKSDYKLVFSIDSFPLELKVNEVLKATISSVFSDKTLDVKTAEDIAITYVTPNIDFGSLPFSYQAIENHKAEDGMEIIITDNRLPTSGWELSAKASGEDLAGSSIRFNNGSIVSEPVKASYDSKYGIYPKTLVVGEESAPQLIANYKTSATGTTDKNVQWTLSYEDIFLNIPAEVMVNLEAKEYQLTISWTLTKGP